MALANNDGKFRGLRNEHMETRDLKIFKDKLTPYFEDNAGAEPKFHYLGMKILQNEEVPEGEVWLVGEDGQKLQVYKI